MKFIIEPINETDCRIIDIDCSGLQGQSVEEITIPATVEQDGKTYQVKEVGPKVCFSNKYDENSAKFAALRHLRKIIFSEGIEVIDGTMNASGSNAVERGNGETLKEVELPSTLKKIGANSFVDCNQLTSINIPDGLEVLGRAAFRNCSSLPIFPWPKSLKIIHEDVFAGMLCPIEKTEDGRTKEMPVEVTIPNNIEEIKGDPYYGVDVICHIESPKAFEVLDKSNKYEVKNIALNRISLISSITSRIININIPEGVKKITAPFESVTQLTLPSTLEEIGDKVFRRNSNSGRLSGIKLPESLKIIGKEAFENSISNTENELLIPSSVIEVGEAAFSGSNLKLVGDEATMKRLMGQPGALNGTRVEVMDIPEGVTEVKVNDCPDLIRINIPTSVTKIVKISNCPKLETLVIPDSVTSIDEISNNESLKELYLSDNLEELLEISSCHALQELRLPDSLKQLGNPNNRWNGPLTGLSAKIEAPVDVWKLICSDPSALKNYSPHSGHLSIPEGVETIAYNMLEGSELISIILPSSLKEIGEGAFETSRKLKNITIPAAVEKLGKKSFAECEALESIEFAEGSQLKEIHFKAFSKTAIKQISLPDGLTMLKDEVFADISTLESITFPASITDWGFGVNDWGNTTTPIVRCKNLKNVILLAEDPATATYPVALGKLCDWYVPDHMVDHVKAFIEKAKADYPKVKGVGAKSVKPLSKLKGGAPETKKKAASKKQALTQQIQMEVIGLKAVYLFAVEEKDVPMLDNDLNMAILAARYLRDKLSECSFKIVDSRARGSSWTVDEMSLITKVNSATEKKWHCTPKSIVKLDFSDPQNLPEDFPTDIAPEVAKHGGFYKLFASRSSNLCKKLPEDAPAYLKIDISFEVLFDFKIGEKEKFNVKKITVMEDWDWESRAQTNWRFAFLYNGRYIPATSLQTSDEGFHMGVRALSDIDGTRPSNTIVTGVGIGDGAALSFGYGYKVDSLPFLNDILSLMK